MSDQTESALQTPVDRQAVIAELGQQALETDDIDRLMRDISAKTAETLDADYCKVLELLPDGDELLVRQGVGWHDGVVGSATAPTDTGSQAGYTLLTEEPILVDDLRTEDRFSGPRLLTSHDVISGISVIIGSVDDPWGVLGVHSTEHRAFTEGDAIFVQNIANTLAAAIEADNTKRRLERALNLFWETERTANVGGWRFDTGMKSLFLTEYLYDLLGIPPEEDPTLEEIYDRYHEDDREIIKNAVRAAIESGERFDVDARFWTPDGELRWLHVKGAPEFQDGEIVSVRGAAQDVTGRKGYERELEASNERLEQFATAISHDLKKPLGTVASYLQLLDRRYKHELDEDAADFIEFAIGSTIRMQDVIDGIVSEYARGESEPQQFGSVDLAAVIDDVLVDLQTEIDKSGANITVETMPCVEGNTGQLHQLLLNLLDNAIKYSGQTPPRIYVSADQDGDRWVISVSDHGIGIDPDDTESVFTAFHRLHEDEEYPGVGIGLALCNRIVERHGGDIWVESEPGEGSTFSVTLSPVKGSGE